jgi:MYXO-CTERM domain-containing protein
VSARHYLALGTACLALGTPRLAAAYCPCYTQSSAYNDLDCGIEAVEGENPGPDEWNEIFAMVAQGPAAWGDQGPTVPEIGQGCGKPEPLHSVPARFPCELLKGIAMAETGWRQFCEPDLPDDQDGKSSRTIISFDCGYGIGQVTSGMHTGETPDFDRARVAAEPVYNMATGTRILAQKWIATNCVGDNQPDTIEHWYTATWAYNGLAYVNNPNNPNYDAFRGVWDPQTGGDAPYQEKVFGRIEHPSNGWWDAVALAYPNRGELGDGGSPGEISEPTCASPTDCDNQRPSHTTACNNVPPDPGTTTDDTTSTTDATTTNPDPTTPPGETTTAPNSTAPDPGTTGTTAADDPADTAPPTTSTPTDPGLDSVGVDTALPPGYTAGADQSDGCGCRGDAPAPKTMLLLLALAPLLRRRPRITARR